jgi:hypothetical protein
VSKAVSWDEWLAPLRDGKWRRFSDLWRRLERDNLFGRICPVKSTTKETLRKALDRCGALYWKCADGHDTYALYPLRGRKKRQPPKRVKPPTTHAYELAFSLPENGGCVFTSSTHHGETTVKLLCYGLPTKIKLEPMRQDQ